MFKAIKEIGITRVIKYLFFGIWEWIFNLLPFSPLRVFWLKVGGAKIGRNCVIEAINFMNLDRLGLNGLNMGKDCYLGTGTLLDLAGKITLGNQVTVAARTIILSHISVGFSDHPLLKYYPKQVLSTQIESGCVLGVASIILPGLTLGQNSLVAAASVVTKNVPAQVMIAGSPAQIKKKLA